MGEIQVNQINLVQAERDPAVLARQLSRDLIAATAGSERSTWPLYVAAIAGVLLGFPALLVPSALALLAIQAVVLGSLPYVSRLGRLGDAAMLCALGVSIAVGWSMLARIAALLGLLPGQGGAIQ